MAERHRDLDRLLPPPDIWQSVGVTVAFLLALAIMLTFPAISYWALLLLAFVDPVVRLLRRRERA